MTKEQDAIVQAETALGENLVWLADQLDLKIRQLNAAWRALCVVLPQAGR